jgi:NADPH:quinone reductase-like Zn-dependent oxidoreductase
MRSTVRRRHSGWRTSIPGPDRWEILVEVRAASVNAADWHVMRSKPPISCAILGLLRPKHKILGVGQGKVIVAMP